VAATEYDTAGLLPLLPEDRVGIVQGVVPISLGLSGAGVYAVSTSRGACVLRVQAHELAQGHFAQQLRILRRAVDAGIAPAIWHVDEAARAVVSVGVTGKPLGVALADPAQRGLVLASVVDRLRTLHALDPLDVVERDPLVYTRAAWAAARDRPGFPRWALALAPTLEQISETLASDPRRVVSHNDVNPGNVLWDGARTWLVDWDVAGLGHPYFDLATLSLFLCLDDPVAFDLAARHDEAPLDEPSQATFRVLRQLAGLLCGLTFLGLVDDLSIVTAPTPREAPSLSRCYEALRRGEFDLQSQRGRASLGLALLALGVASDDGA
jgi:aminoglycoside phosphotransferase (APT) family kinase protein